MLVRRPAGGSSGIAARCRPASVLPWASTRSWRKWTSRGQFGIVGLVFESVVIPRQFNGPLESGNGGYCCGVIAKFIDGVAEVSLRRPVPLDSPLDVKRENDGSVRVLHDETLIATARAAGSLDIEVPAPPSPHEARRAAARYRGCRRACSVAALFAGARGRTRSASSLARSTAASWLPRRGHRLPGRLTLPDACGLSSYGPCSIAPATTRCT